MAACAARQHTPLPESKARWPAQASVDVMLPGLEDKEAGVRQVAARFLGQLGPDAKAAIPALTKAQRDEDEEVSKAAAEVLWKIRRSDIYPFSSLNEQRRRRIPRRRSGVFLTRPVALAPASEFVLPAGLAIACS
ncbi:MAG: HEAT repeat domain-containing protein [Gemmataceae bacterium]